MFRAPSIDGTSSAIQIALDQFLEALLDSGIVTVEEGGRVGSISKIDGCSGTRLGDKGRVSASKRYRESRQPTDS